MSGKKLSTGTLSLRFMRNKQSKEVELEQAHIEDDGQWEVAKDVRDSWGTTAESEESVSYEPSYLPFLFPSLSGTADSTSPNQTVPKGRRVFKKGQEVFPEKAVLPESSEASQTPAEAEAGSTPSSSSPPAKKHSMRTVSSNNSRPISKSTRVAKLAIFDTSQVGTDLRPPTKTNLASSSTSSSGPSKTEFLKPAGVDEPKAPDVAHDDDNAVITSAREVKVKRERTSQPDGDGSVKRKKKKRKTAAE